MGFATMEALQTFDFEGEPVRIEERGGEPWFVGQDVCRCLGHGNHRQALSRLDDDEKDDVQIVDAIGRKQTMTVINEPGMYQLVFSSRTEAAKKFKRWVTHDVLPSIRRTGSYVAPGGEAGSETGAVVMPQVPVEELRTMLQLIREARLLRGRAAGEAMWKASGLPPLPVPVLTQQNDGYETIRAWMAECLCEAPHSERMLASELYGEYAEWCEMHEVETANTTRFGREMGRVFPRYVAGVTWYRGVARS